jgi:5-methyltetrahydrofolate--homocysteine methyltransferase
MMEELRDAIVTGHEEKVRELTEMLIEGGVEPADILKNGLIAGMEIVGQRFKVYEIYLPEVLMSAVAMKTAMGYLKPFLIKAGHTEDVSLGKVVLATIEGDVHDIGKNLVGTMLEGAGFEIIDLGVDVPVRKIIEAFSQEKAHLIGISALLTTSMMALEDAIAIIKKDIPHARVMVGGASLTKEFADKIGADGFAPDALRAIHLAKNFVSKK